jgi:hypothetical protein
MSVEMTGGVRAALVSAREHNKSAAMRGCAR